MSHPLTTKQIQVALVLTSAAFLISCRGKHTAAEVDYETLKTQQSENLIMINSNNGVLEYRFETPLMERYELAKEPYMEFREGIHVVTFNDSTQLVESELTANYAKLIEPIKLWEARGNVVATNAQGQVLETEQLFWDQVSDRIYSNVESKITQGDDVIVGIGFESNSKFDDFTFRRPRGQVTVDTEPNTESDSTAVVYHPGGTDSIPAPLVWESSAPATETADSPVTESPTDHEPLLQTDTVP